MNPQHIKNIIFDLGNVIIDLDLARTEREFEALLGSDYRLALQKHNLQTVFERYETGMIDEDTFLNAMQQAALPKVVQKTDIIKAWNAMLLTIPAARFDMLLQLKQHYRVFLLSNTNKTHLDWVYNYLKTTYDIQDFETRYFHKDYYSHLIHLRKPNVEIYEYVLQDANLNANESVFIDDVAANIEGAKQAGLHTIHHVVGAEIVDVMEAFLKRPPNPPKEDFTIVE